MEDNVLGRAAEAAYFGMLALVPFLVLLISLLGRFAPEAWIGKLNETLYYALPQSAFALISAQITDIRGRPAAGVISISAILTLWAAAGLFSSLIDCLNAIYDV